MKISMTMTNKELLQAWDEGYGVFSCSMGGLGPSYEQVIQLLAFEMLRVMMDIPIDWSKATNEEIEERCDLVTADSQVSALIEKLHPSGAQMGAAVNMATMIDRNGYAEAMKQVPKDRIIVATKKFPSIEVLTEHPDLIA